jgi:hypothetical protein
MQDDNVKVTCALVDHPPIKMALAYRFDTANRSVVFLRQYPKDRLPDRPRQSGRCPGLRRAIPPWNSRTCRPAGRPRIYSYARRPRSNPAGAAALLAHPIVSTSDPELPLRVNGGCRRQVDCTAGLPSTPEMPCAPRQLRFVP